MLAAMTLAAAVSPAQVHGPILTWHDDPATTMTVTWLHTSDGFAPGTWAAGPAGFGFGDGDDATVLDAMKNAYTRLYLRHVFEVGEIPANAELELDVLYDDGFIAYLNGVELARRSVDSGAGPAVRSVTSHEAADVELVELPDWRSALTVGRNVFAVEVHNTSTASTDLTFDPLLRWSDAALAPAIAKGATWHYMADGEAPEGWTALDFDLDAPVEWAPLADLAPPLVRIRAKGTSTWREVTGVLRPFAATGDQVARVDVTELEPGTEYEFARDDAAPRWFTTAPATLDEPIRFVTGGDMFHNRTLLDAMNARAGAEAPLFALLGGDLAYGNAVDHARWRGWIDSWSQFAVAPDGRMIPMLIAPGNHETEVTVARENAEHRGRLWYALFGRGDESYDVLDFASGEMSVVLLDTNVHPVAGAQAEWLADTLATRTDATFLFACYHEPTFGTAKPPNLEVWEHWVPLFEQHQMTAVFENDHHTYKRTHLIHGFDVDEERGILYLGDGAWGVSLRDVPAPGEMWYLAHAESRLHLIRVDVSRDGVDFAAMDADGTVFDESARPPRATAPGE